VALIAVLSVAFLLVALLSESSCEGYGAESQSYGDDVFEERNRQVSTAEGARGILSGGISTQGSGHGADKAASTAEVEIAG
jgi:hypothetical protein